MGNASIAVWLLAQETRGMLTRLARVKPFALQETMLPAAAVSTAAQTAIEYALARRRRRLRAELREFLRWLESPTGRAADPSQAQRRYALLKLKFNVILSHVDIFADALTQRSEHDTGLWLAGLDAAATDGLTLPGSPFQPPPVVCYLARGLGGAIRRARTRLPGGGENPVALVRIPRERMVGAGIASSLFHEVGHQGAALLGLVESLRDELLPWSERDPARALLRSWISEIVADLWAVARVGVVSTMGLMSIVSLPRPFVFRVNPGDPHPMPWYRVHLSATLGEALYPHPQWRRLREVWSAYYPPRGLDGEVARLLDRLDAQRESFAQLLVEHRPPSLGGHALRELLVDAGRQPAELARLHAEWRERPRGMRRAAPSLAFAVIGQARFDGRISPEEESRVLGDLIAYWALRTTVDTAALAAVARRRPVALVA